MKSQRPGAPLPGALMRAGLVQADFAQHSRHSRGVLFSPTLPLLLQRQLAVELLHGGILLPHNGSALRVSVFVERNGVAADGVVLLHSLVPLGVGELHRDVTDGDEGVAGGEVADVLFRPEEEIDLLAHESKQALV